MKWRVINEMNEINSNEWNEESWMKWRVMSEMKSNEWGQQ